MSNAIKRHLSEEKKVDKQENESEEKLDLTIKYIPPKTQKIKVKQPNELLPQLFFTLIVAGPRGSGKSQLIRNMLLRNDMYKAIFKPDHIFIFCPSLDLNGDFDDIKAKWKFPFYSNEAVEKIMELQQSIIKKFGKRKAPPLLLIFDDCLDSGALSWHSLLETIFIRGRHLNISIIIVSQHINRISRTMRLNADYFCYFKPSNQSEIDDFLKQYVDRRNRDEMYQKIKQIFTKPHSFIVIDNKIKNSKMRYREGFNNPIYLGEDEKTNLDEI
jgi:hypothetical protein